MILPWPVVQDLRWITDSGWTSLIVSLWLLSGLNILMVGVIAIYISKIYAEIKRRPYTIARSVRRGVPGEAERPQEI